ncbi:SpoIIE family protein phosphatase [Yinghuangia seranimata]|uniref:SpoIIE family protein phosphatase n=1 Tax=Yinghuangia seranimata TaxID=408067 RepID=UPI00248C4853|nr:SpoIIE family protein phosphatase [Yinghuangia seranimata]MDI2128677.1 SpoIIE family protein phosphatase [Yinghuangia seranimata]
MAAVTDDMVRDGPSEASDTFETAVLDALGGESAVAFALYDRDLRYLRISEALARLNRVPAADHLGRRPTELLPEGLAREIEKTIAMVFAHGLPYTETDIVLSPPDWYETRHHEARWVPVPGADGGVEAVLAIVSDVTEHRHREELLRSSQWRTSRLQLMTARLAGALTVAEVEAAVSELGRSIDADESELRLLDDVAPVFPWPNVPGPGVNRRLRVLPPEWPNALLTAVREGTPMYLGAAPEHDPKESSPVPAMRRARTASPLTRRSSVVLPLLGSGAPMGVIRFAFHDSRAFGPDDRVFLEAFAGQCALAVERSRLYEREHRTAVALQRSLLPDRLPIVDGAEFGFRYLPGAPDYEVGGDWYDVFKLLDGRVAIVVGDVIGKGLTAAAGMGRVRAALRALAFTDPDPVAVLTGLDRLFTATEDDESLTTLIYGVIDPETGILDLVDAGHLPVIIVSAYGKAKLADAGPASTPLGVVEPRTKHTMRLDPGDILVGFSDGLIENRARGIDEGLEQMLEVARNATGGLESLLSSILERLLDGQDRDDDVTILGVRIVESQGSAG